MNEQTRKQVISLLTLAKDKTVTAIDFAPGWKLPDSLPQLPSVHEPTLRYCVNKGWVELFVFEDSYSIGTNRSVPCRVTKLLLTSTGEVELFELEQVEQTVQQPSQNQPVTKSDKSKPKGRPSKQREREKVAEHYNQCVKDGTVSGQADFLRKFHKKYWEENQNSAKSWLCQLLAEHDSQSALKQRTDD